MLSANYSSGLPGIGPFATGLAEYLSARGHYLDRSIVGSRYTPRGGSSSDGGHESIERRSSHANEGIARRDTSILHDLEILAEVVFGFGRLRSGKISPPIQWRFGPRACETID
jgi:hypothetical protein